MGGKGPESGAGERNRTPDLLITNEFRVEVKTIQDNSPQ